MSQGNGHSKPNGSLDQSSVSEWKHPFTGFPVDPRELFAGFGDRFHVWRQESDGRKMPFRHENYPAKSNDPSTWTSLTSALAVLKIGGFSGLAVQMGQLPDGRYLVGLDFDLCRDFDGGIHDWALELIGRLPTYGEISPSGTGIKQYGILEWLPEVLGTGGIECPVLGADLPTGWPSLGHSTAEIAIYPGKRFMAWTGQHLDTTPLEICDITEPLAQLAYELRQCMPARRPLVSNAGDGEIVAGAMTSELLGRIETDPTVGPRWRNEDQLADRSKADFRLALDMIKAGFTKAETAAALDEYPHGQIGSRKPGVDWERATRRCIVKAIQDNGGEVDPNQVDVMGLIEALRDRSAGIMLSARARAAEAALEGADPDTGELPSESAEAPPGAQEPGLDGDSDPEEAITDKALVLSGARGKAPEPLILAPGGLLQDIAEWTMRTARYPQPLLALAGAISAVGTLASRRFIGPTGARPNVMTIAVAGSGAGKNAALACVSALLHMIDDRYVFGGELKSSAGLSDAFTVTPVQLIIQDEFGQFLKSISAGSGVKVQGYKADLLAKITEIYTDSHKIRFGGKLGMGAKSPDPEKQKTEKQLRRDAVQPALNMITATTPERLWEAVSWESIADGSLARFLVFQAETNSPERVPATEKPEDPPKHVLDAAGSLMLGPVDPYHQTAVLDVLETIHNPKEQPALIRVQYADEGAREAALWIEDEAEELRRRAEGTPSAAIYARRFEMTQKLALLHAVSRDSRAPRIDEDSLHWAHLTVKHCQDAVMEGAKRNIAANEFERNALAVLKVIRQRSPINARDLHDTVRLRGREMADVIDNLEQSGRIVVETLRAGGKGRPGKVYRVR